MSENEVILHDIRANSPVFPIVNIGTAYANGLYCDLDLLCAGLRDRSGAGLDRKARGKNAYLLFWHDAPLILALTNC